jgi:hypothetical protein
MRGGLRPLEVRGWREKRIKLKAEGSRLKGQRLKDNS